MCASSNHDPQTLAGTNLVYARSHNRRVVIEAVRLHQSLTRAEIARLTALTPQTVSNIVGELQASGMITAHETIKAGRGQPATPFTICPDGAYSIGVQLDHQSITGVLVDLAGRIRARVAIAVERPTPEIAMPLLDHVVQQLRTDANVDWQRMLGIGLVMPGPFGVEGMSSIGPTTLPGWSGFDIETALEQRTGLRVLLENDANAAAIGERLYGVARTLSSFAYVFIGTGLGGGIFLNGNLYRGVAKNAGEIGHMVVTPDGRPCYCGNHGCLERYVSLDALQEHLRQSGLPPDIDALTDAQIDAWLVEAVPPLRQAINILEAMLDIECVVLGGFVSERILNRLLVALPPLYASVRSGFGPPQRILKGCTGADTAVLGASALPIFDEFNPKFEALLKHNN